ncbi:SGNH/GDSL hydrolase family protein [Leifsonia sp. WHRI 6310E]|uniref:SGNH/GDSL hydrolase family protein n=1 Tax=Leifsonia sp. WHRI 6310E TaxID=3162562 RepID=UPI0032EE4E9A
MTQRLVFAGDSITDAGRDRTDDGSYGDGYVALIVDDLAAQGADVVVVNRGIAGDRTVDLERRWEQDVRAEGPDVLTIAIGVNDMWRRFDSDDPTSAADFEATYRRLLDRADARVVLLVEPYVVPIRPDQAEWATDLDEKRAVIARLADETGARFVPVQAAFSRAAEQHGAAAIAPDGVHPTPAGSRLLADAWLAAYETIPASDLRAEARA